MKTILYSQSLDNTSPNSIKQDDVFIDANEKSERNKAFNKISTILDKGRYIFKNGHVRITKKQKWITIEIPSKERDVSNRASQLICLTGYDKDWVTTGDRVICELKKFAKEINRNINEDDLNEIRDFFAHKEKTGKNALRIGVIVSVGAIILFIYFIKLLTALIK